MIVTDRFVYIHMPKTGGTFVTTVLFRLKDELGTSRVPTRSLKTGFRPRISVHDTCGAIPRVHRHKRILSCYRNPYDLYVSEYEFGWWKRPEYDRYFRRRVPDLRQRYPHFPNLSFQEFVRLYNRVFRSGSRNGRFGSDAGVGMLTERFLRFYARSGWWRIRTTGASYFDSGRVRADLYDVHFLRTHRLNQDLYDFLLEAGYGSEQVGFVLEMGRVLPGGKGRSRDQKWQKYYTPGLKKWVRRKERLLFELFPEFDV